MNKRNAFIYVGASYPQLRGIRQLSQTDLHLVVTDVKQDAVGADLADEFVQMSATDVDGFVRLGKRLSEDFNVLGAYGVADYAYSSIAALHDALDIPWANSDVISLMIDKGKTKKAWREEGVPTPKVLWQGKRGETPDNDTLAQILSFQNIILKPVGSNNSEGIVRQSRPSAESVFAAIETILGLSAEILIEEYADGKLVNVDGLMVDGEFFPVSTTDRQHHDDITFSPLYMMQPGDFYQADLDRFGELSCQAALALGYKDGPLTLDVIYTEDDAWAIEISPHFHNIACETIGGRGLPLKAWCDYLSRDLNWRLNLNWQSDMCVLFYEMKYHGEAGIISQIENLGELDANPCVVDFFQFKHEGASVRHGSSCFVVWIASSDRAEAYSVAKHLEQVVRVRTETTIPDHA